MASYHIGQTYPDLLLETELDISAGVSFYVIYKKPNGRRGTWSGVLDGSTKIRRSISIHDFDVVGTWSLQAYAVITVSPLKVVYGDATDFIVKATLQDQNG